MKNGKLTWRKSDLKIEIFFCETCWKRAKSEWFKLGGKKIVFSFTFVIFVLDCFQS